VPFARRAVSRVVRAMLHVLFHTRRLGAKSHLSRVVALSVRCSRVMFLWCACCSRKSLRVVFVPVACRRHSFARSCRASGSRFERTSRVDHVCRVASVRDNKLLSLIDTHVNNINS
jgi:hypothetical protein